MITGGDGGDLLIGGTATIRSRRPRQHVALLGEGDDNFT